MSSQSKAYLMVSSSKSINAIGLKFGMVRILGKDCIHTKFQLSILITSMSFTTMAPIFWEFLFFKNSYLRIPWRYQKETPFGHEAMCTEPSKKFSGLRLFCYSQNWKNKFKTVIGNYAWNIGNSEVKLPLNMQIWQTIMVLSSFLW